MEPKGRVAHNGPEEIFLQDIADLRESKINPRRHFDSGKMDELVASIKEHSIIDPLLIRPVREDGVSGGTAFEIVYGVRRKRAAEKLKMQQVPCVVRNLSDEEAMSLRLVENLQREDIHPLDEAQGYADLVEFGKVKVEQLPVKVGKDSGHIARRMSLLRLSDKARKIFLDGKLTEPIAFQLSRLQPNDQKEMLGELKDREWEWTPQAFSRRAARLMLRLGNAPWDLKDEKLHGGSCLSCQKRTGAVPALFPDIKETDICTDRSCFDKKGYEHAAVKLKDAEKTGKPLSKIASRYSFHATEMAKKLGMLASHEYRIVTDRCEHARDAIIVYGEEIGQVKTICAEKRCKVHSGRIEKSEDQRSRDKQAKQKRQRDALIRMNVIRMIAANSYDKDKFSAAELLLIAKVCIGNIAFEDQRELCRFKGLDVKKAKDRFVDFGKPLLEKIEKARPSELRLRIMEAVLAGLPLRPMLGVDASMTLQSVASKKYRIDLKDVERIVAAQQERNKKKPKVKSAIVKKARAKIGTMTASSRA